MSIFSTASKFIVAIALALPLFSISSNALSDPLLVCKATENAFDALDNNCDGDVDDKEELDNLGIITGTDWYLYSTSSVELADLCFEEGGTIQCQSHQDSGLGNCVGQNRTGNYLCSISTASGSGSSSSSNSESSNTGPSNTGAASGNNGSTNTGASSGPTLATNTSGGSNTNDSNDNSNVNEDGGEEETQTNNDGNNENNGNDNPNADVCLFFEGIEKCVTTADNGNSCEDAGNGIFYCASEPDQLPDPSFCIPANEVYNGIDDNCDGEIDEGVEPPLRIAQVANIQSEPVAVSAPAPAALFGLGLIALALIARKTKNS